MQRIKNIIYSLISLRARRAGVKIGKEVRLSPNGKYTVMKNAKITISDGVWLAPGHQLFAEEGSEIFIGPGVHFGERLKLIAAEPNAHVFIDGGCFFNHDISIIAHTNILIGENSIFGPYCYFSDHNHRTNMHELIKNQSFDVQPVKIGSDVWLGVGATVLKGGCVGDGAVVAARAVVTKPIPDNEIWGGVPAKKIGERS